MAEVEGIDFNREVLDMNGKPLEEGFFEDEDQDRGEWLQEKAKLVGKLIPDEAEELLALRRERAVRLGNYCCQALWATLREDKSDGTQKLRRAKLALKIQSSADPDAPYPTLVLNSKQKKLILDQGEKMWGTLVYARVYEALEGTLSGEDE